MGRLVSYPETQTCWLEATDQVAVGLRRYSDSNPGAVCSKCERGYHQALVYTSQRPARFAGNGDRRHLQAPEPVSHGDSRWPGQCASCGYRFTADDPWQDWQELLYRRTDSGELVVLHSSAPAPNAPSAPPGACWDAWWMPPSWRGPDGIALMVRLPNGLDWHVDGQASNCTRKGEPHKCWIRHGDPRECRLTVDKTGDTCSAGAGSIAAGDYHGFLRAGVLTAG